ncbi:energy transducer TonB [Dyella terrae]|uniref:energy transducer TonB n=1 Tax=Dyella terrae TaxID=522259 RepID=UPI003D18EC46
MGAWLIGQQALADSQESLQSGHCTSTFTYRYRPVPPYPATARKQHHAGTTVLDIVVNPDGTPNAVKVYGSSGYPELDQSALATAGTWHFSPVTCKENGLPTQGHIRVPITFGA